MRARESPRMVERICPTCIGLATLGELKSMTIFRGEEVLSKKSRSEPAAVWRAWIVALVLRRKLRKPGPAMSTDWHHSETSSFDRTSEASWRGFSLAALARLMSALVW